MAAKFIPPVGGTFQVGAQEDFMVEGRVLARYLPGHEYRVTMVNALFVADLLEKEKAALVAVASLERVGGVATTG